jgi:RNA polymerase primary sigma factor
MTKRKSAAPEFEENEEAEPKEEMATPEEEGPLKEELEDEAPTKEELEEEESEITPADLTIPLEQFEEPGVVDDSVRMYLHEIGRVPLLSADDEKRLAQQMEQGKRITEIKEYCRKELGHEPRATEVIQGMIREIGQAAAFIQACSRFCTWRPATASSRPSTPRNSARP